MKKIKKLSIKDTVLFCDQLSLLVMEHIPLLDASAILRATYPQHGSFLQENLRTGRTLADVLSEIMNFPSHARFMISVAEQSGALAVGLHELTELLKERSSVKKNIIQAMFYPAILLFASAGLFCVLLFIVLPKIRVVYDSVNAPLPLITKTLFFFSDYFMFIFGGFLGVISLLVAVYFLFKKHYSKQFYATVILILRLPILSSILAGFWTQTFFKTLHTATLSRASFDNAISIALQGFPPYIFGTFRQHIVDRIRQGASLIQTLQEYDRVWLFTPYSVALVKLIEYSVPIERICTIINALAQQELQRRIKLFERISEPFILTLVACVIGGIAFAVLIPLYSLTQHIHVR